MEKINRPDSYWKEKLTPEQYAVCRKGGTERPFSGEYYHFKEEGVYSCVGCDLPLFRSEEKYESGSGWPSYWACIDSSHIEVRLDESHGMIREEILCARCGSHLGHVFNDGPPPSHKRFCVNSLSLKFTKSHNDPR